MDLLLIVLGVVMAVYILVKTVAWCVRMCRGRRQGADRVREVSQMDMSYANQLDKGNEYIESETTIREIANHKV